MGRLSALLLMLHCIALSKRVALARGEQTQLSVRARHHAVLVIFTCVRLLQTVSISTLSSPHSPSGAIPMRRAN